MALYVVDASRRVRGRPPAFSGLLRGPRYAVRQGRLHGWKVVIGVGPEFMLLLILIIVVIVYHGGRIQIDW